MTGKGGWCEGGRREGGWREGGWREGGTVLGGGVACAGKVVVELWWTNLDVGGGVVAWSFIKSACTTLRSALVAEL